MALPIAEILNAKDGEGSFGGRVPVRLPLFEASETLRIDERFDLPKPLAEFCKTVLERTAELISGSAKKLLADNADHLFPHGAGSERLLHTTERAPFPQLMHEDPNKVWIVGGPQVQTVQLDRNGFVEQNAAFVRLRAPDGLALATLYGDDKVYMDLLLKAQEVRRTVGSDSVRVTSLGKPQGSSHFIDRWGRTWQVRDWAIPYDDQYLSVASLPTPDGYVAALTRINSGFLGVIHKTQQVLCDYVYVTMQGSLAQWQDYLAQQGAQPKAFDAIRIRIDPEREVAFHSDRYEVTIKSELVKLSKNSMLFLDFGFSGEGDAVTWGVTRLVLSEGPHTNNWIHVVRHTEPPASLPDSWQSNWSKLKTSSFPYNGLIESQNGQTRISTAVQPPGSGPDGHVRYGLEVTREGVQSQETMSRRLELLQHSFTALREDGK